MINDAKHLFMYLLAIYMSSLEKYLLRTYFLIKFFLLEFFIYFEYNPFWDIWFGNIFSYLIVLSLL